jgi:tetratricopeptide (TPR) repeat protein
VSDLPAPAAAPAQAAKAPAAYDTAAPTLRARLLGLLHNRLAAVATAAALFGLAAALMIPGHPEPPADDILAADVPPKPALADPSPPAAPAKAADPRTADALIKEGRYADALALLAPVARAAAPQPAWLFRLALCQEHLDQQDAALNLYRAVVANAGDHTADLAALAQARIYLRRYNAGEAVRLLAPLVLQADRYPRDAPIVAEAEHLVALALAQRLFAPRADLEYHGWSPHRLPWNPERYLSWPEAHPKQAEPRAARIILAPGHAGAEPVLAEALLPSATAREAIERLAQVSGLTLSWTDQAKTRAGSRQIALAVGNRLAIEVLQYVAQASELFCLAEAGAGRIVTLEEAAAEQITQVRLTMARRALQDASARHPDHLWTPAAYLARGNLEADANPDEAISWYERLLAEAPRSKLTLEASYQRGWLLQAKGNHAEARKAFFRVADQAPGHPLAPLALWRVGLMYLEEAETGRAISVLRRGAGLGGSGSTRAHFALALAAAHATSETPQPALSVLAKHRDVFPDDSFRRTASFLAAYARYRQAALQKRELRYEQDLLTTLVQLPAETPLKSYGQHLVARTYAELGLWEEAARTLEHALPQAHGALAQEMKYRLAVALLTANKTAKAEKLLTELADGSDRWTRLAAFQLAKLDLEAKRLDACLDRCRQLMDDGAGLNAAEVLTVMGRAYERQGRFALAAQCFAGQVPE